MVAQAYLYSKEEQECMKVLNMLSRNLKLSSNSRGIRHCEIINITLLKFIINNKDEF